MLLVVAFTLVGCGNDEAPADEPEVTGFVEPISLANPTQKVRAYETFTQEVEGVVTGVQKTRYGQEVVEMTQTDGKEANPDVFTIKANVGAFENGDEVVGVLNIHDEIVGLRLR